MLTDVLVNNDEVTVGIRKSIHNKLSQSLNFTKIECMSGGSYLSQ